MSSITEDTELLSELMDYYMDALVLHLSIVNTFSWEKPPLITDDICYLGYPSLEVAKKADAFLKVYGDNVTNNKAGKVKEYFLPYLKLLIKNRNATLEEIGFVGSVLSRKKVELPLDKEPNKKKSLLTEFNELNETGGFTT
jgi:hypothetical protein